MAEGDYTLVLAFDSDDPEFTRGFNAGSIYGWLDAHAGTLGVNAEPPFAVRTDNLEMVLRIGEALGYEVVTEDSGGDHLGVHFTRPGEVFP